MPWFWHEAEELSRSEVDELALRLLSEARSRLKKVLRKVLLLPPDLTRAHSGAGKITETLYKALAGHCDVHVIPTLGQHVPHTAEQNRWMFGKIPDNHIHIHDWLGGVTRVGTIPSKLVEQSTGGLAGWDIPVDLNTSLVRESWDLIINIGHVVPHEVLGFANHNKNYFIGLGGKETICTSHMAAAIYGIENNLGEIITPLRSCFNWAENEFLGHLPDVYFQVVMKRSPENRLVTCGVYVGDDLETYMMAARASKRENITIVDEPIHKIVAVMQADEFHSTWVANKAVYRTRMALADAGELLIIAPGLERFGEQESVEELIRKYGYRGTPVTLKQYRENVDLQRLAHATAHLLHGSSEGRFTISYAPGYLSKQEIEQVGYSYVPLEEALKRYPPERMTEGWNTMPDGEKVFFISTPSSGLWATKQRMDARLP
ncbi:MAG: lactate racemase domain-containing protein [Acidobacteriota bacterium]|nr:lactate racemase domain-containing protein [Acidobacteriota bacterium]